MELGRKLLRKQKRRRTSLRVRFGILYEKDRVWDGKEVHVMCKHVIKRGKQCTEHHLDPSLFISYSEQIHSSPRHSTHLSVLLLVICSRVLEWKPRRALVCPRPLRYSASRGSKDNTPQPEAGHCCVPDGPKQISSLSVVHPSLIAVNHAERMEEHGDP